MSSQIEDEETKSHINEYFKIFKNQIESKILELPCQAIHCDGNDYNLMVRPGFDGPCFAGLIDFGDMVSAPVVCDVATAAAYLVLDKKQPLQALTAFVRGYASRHPLSVQEIEMIFPLLMVRLGVSLVNSAIVARDRPDDPYVSISRAPALAFLEQCRTWNRAEVALRLREACGLGISDSAARVEAWIAERRQLCAGDGGKPCRGACLFHRGGGFGVADGSDQS